MPRCPILASTTLVGPARRHQLDLGTGIFTMGSLNPFGKIPVSQTIEETINKDTQTPGGTKGFSLKHDQTPGGTKGFSLKHDAVQKYVLNAEYRSIFLRQLREMVGLGGSKLNHPDLQPTIIKDEADVQALVSLTDNCWINPFRADQDNLVNLATAAMATTDIANDLVNSSKIGEAAYQEFKINRLEKDEASRSDFFATMRKQKLKTFCDLHTKKVKCKGREIVLKADRGNSSVMDVALCTQKSTFWHQYLETYLCIVIFYDAGC